MRAMVLWLLLGVTALVGCAGGNDGGADEAAVIEEEVTAADEGDGAGEPADPAVDDDDDAIDEAVEEAAHEADEAEPSVELPDDEPIPPGAVAPGAYRTGAFTVPAAFEVAAEGWYAAREGPFWLGLYRADDFGSARPDPSSWSLVGVQIPTTVEQLIADLEALSDDVFTVTDTAPTSVGGLDGTVLEAELTGNKVFGPLQSSSGQWSIWAEDRLVAIHVLETGANPVVVWVDAERDDHAAHLERVQPILDSLVFAP